MSGNGEGKELEEVLIAKEEEVEGEEEGSGGDEDSDKVHRIGPIPTLNVE